MSRAGPHSRDREDTVAGGGVLQLISSHFKGSTLIIQTEKLGPRDGF